VYNQGVKVYKKYLGGPMSSWITRAKEEMRKQKLTQEDVAKAMGKTTRGAVGHYFTGRSTPNIKQVIKLAEYLKVPFAWLVAGDETVDEELLEMCLQLVEEAELQAKLTLTEKQKAKSVTYLYKLSKEGQQVTNKNALELIKLYA
jgi:transcriptional regulator with XRE-family HTH domain